MNYEIRNDADIEALRKRWRIASTNAEVPGAQPEADCQENTRFNGHGTPQGADYNEKSSQGSEHRDRTGRNRESESHQVEKDLPDIVINDRQLRDTANEAMKALRDANIPPEIFVRTGSMVSLMKNEKGRIVIAEMTEAHLRGRLARSANFFRLTKTAKLIGVSPPKDLVEDILAMAPANWGFPPIEAVIEVPVLRPDGTILHVPGYDPATCLYYAPDPDLQIPNVPEMPNKQQVNDAVSLLNSIISDFPFVDTASKANAVAMLLTPHLLAAIDASTPIALVDATSAGTGKSLLVDVTALIATGRPADMMSAPKDPDEWRKQITTVLMDGRQVVAIDNVSSTLDSPELCKAITERSHSDRLMATHRSVTLPVKCAWMANGNNIKAGGDMPRRCYWSRMDAETSTPFNRHGFAHPDLKGWVGENRGGIIAAILTLARAWFAAGRQVPKIKPLGSFENWTVIVGGILENAGIADFLTNAADFFSQADTESIQWEGFLDMLAVKFSSAQFTVAEVVQALTETSLYGRLTPAAEELRGVVPDSIIESIDKRGQLSRRLGNAFSQRESRRFGDRQLHIRRTGGISHNAQCWKVFDKDTAKPVPPPAGS